METAWPFFSPGEKEAITQTGREEPSITAWPPTILGQRKCKPGHGAALARRGEGEL